MVLLKTVRNELVNKLRFATVSPKQEELYKQIVNKMNEICPPQTCDRKMVIGKGGNGQVIARDQERTIARKLLTSDDPHIIQREYEIMKKYHGKASHLFVKPYSLGNYYYDMQLLKNYEGLDSLIKKKSLTDSQKISITKQLLKGLEIFRQNKSAHGDLKPANIMVKIDPSDDSVQVKIIDLGSVCDTDPCKNDAGTLVYQPPNMIIQKGESTLSQVQRYDLYAMGIILFQLFNNKTTEQLAKNTDEIRLSQQQKQKLKAQLKDKGISSIPDIFLSNRSSPISNSDIQ
jgi:serine/threonine protein kinase